MDGARIAELRFTSPGGRVTHWRMKLQNTIRGTRPDVHFVRLDATGPEVAVYLDGYKYHASAQHNRLADDAAKRAVLRAQPMYVFAVTWDDVQRWSGRAVSAEPVWPPYLGNGQRAARQYFLQLGGTSPDELNSLVWTNPIDTLLAYLADPDAQVWCRRATAVLAGLLTQPGEKTAATSDTLAVAVSAALHGATLPPPTAGGAITLLRTADGAGCPLTVFVDGRTAARTFSALTVVDDRHATVDSGDDRTHRRRWTAWLYWGNLIQFLDAAGGDGTQLARTTLDAFEPGELAVSEGTGLAQSRRALELDEQTATWLGRPRVAGPRPDLPSVDDGKASRRWREVIDLLMPDESGLESLVRGLAAGGAPTPEHGYELGDAGWPAELAWPRQRVAVVLGAASNERERQDRDGAYAAHGWDARTAREWTVEELATRIKGSGQTLGKGR